ncbi:MAG: DUF3341 domain-containing protein [Caulobacteraceae bacterium]
MSEAVLAAFATEADFSRALAEAKRLGVEVIDAFTPYLPESGEDARDPGPGRVTAAVAIGGFATAAAFYLLELATAAILYPFDSGGRPHNSWPTFIMGPFEFGVFIGGLSGFIALLIHCGLPRPHQPLFYAEGIERATQDRFFLALAPGEAAEALALRMGAVDAQRVEL